MDADKKAITRESGQPCGVLEKALVTYIRHTFPAL